MVKRGKYRKGVFIVIYRKQGVQVEYLLFKRKLHWKGWEFCKGGCEAKESDNKCALREIKEETGQKAIDIKKYAKSGKYLYNKELKDREGVIGQTYNLFSAGLKSKKIKFSKEEHSEYKWLSFEKTIKMLTWPNQRVCLRLVDKGLS